MKRLLGILVLTGCSSVPVLPEGTGRGLEVHGVAPVDAAMVARPSWEVGRVFEFDQGGNTRIAFRVASGPADASFALINDESGLVQLFDESLGRQGELYPGVEGAIRALEPADAQCAWPLWVGKRWSSHFMLKAPGQAVAVIAEYHCDARETIRVPAGEFECLRIWRTARSADNPDGEHVTSVAWYAPSVGYFVRRLAEGVLTELAAVR